MQKRRIIWGFIAVITVFTACSKVVEYSNSSGSGGSGTSGGGASTQNNGSYINPLKAVVGTANFNTNTYSFFKFFNVMDYGAVSILINDSLLSGTVAEYYPSSYIKYNQRKVNIKVVFNNIQVLSEDMDAVVNNFYSVFVYKVGYQWKISIVNDIPNSMTTYNAGVRVLDFRTQAYFDYVNVRLFSPGLQQITFTKRLFLDHTTYSSYSYFDSMYNGTYSCYVYNDTANLLIKNGLVFDSSKYYTILLLTPSALAPAAAINAITLDVEPQY